MRKIAASLVLLGCLVGAASGAMAKDSPPMIFIDFPNLVIYGELKAPAVSFENARDKVRFERLMRMDKRFLEPLEENGTAGLETTFK